MDIEIGPEAYLGIAIFAAATGEQGPVSWLRKAIAARLGIFSLLLNG